MAIIITNNTSKSSLKLNGNEHFNYLNGLVNGWMIEGGTTTTIAGNVDLSETANITYSGDNAVFNGASSYMKSNGNVYLYKDLGFTVTTKFRLASLTSPDDLYGFLSISRNTGLTYPLFSQYYYDNDNDLRGLTRYTGTIPPNGLVESPNSYCSPNTWYTLTITLFPTGTLKMYVNGNYVAEDNDGHTSDIYGYVNVGRLWYENYGWLYGDMTSLIGIWNKGMTADEIALLYNTVYA